MRRIRYLRFGLIAILAFALLPGGPAFVPVLSGAGKAAAQEQQRRRTLLDLLMGNERPAPQVQETPKVRQGTRRITKRRSSPSTSSRRVVVSRKAAPSAPAKATERVEKSENARKILVVGDFIADGMAQGLEDAFADVPGIVIVSRANGSSGFVRDDFYDWPASIGPILEETDPAIVIVLIGSNDRQAMRTGGRSEKVRTEAWDKEYVARVNRFAKTIQESGTPLIWVGGPPFRFKSMSADILAFNDFFRTAAESVGGVFVDIWDGFVDADGGFILSGSDINGQTVRLRASDGINFTSEGKRKIAFYAERQIRQLLGDAASPLLTTLAPESYSTMRLPPLQSESELVRFNPIRVDDPELDGGAVLLGDVAVPEPEAGANPLQAKSLRSRLVQDGIPPPPQAGRANDFRWPEEKSNGSAE